MSRNITEVLLLRVPLESDYKHTLWFETKEEQTAYFQSKVVYTGYDFSYQRKDKVIRYPKDYDELLGCNYVMYKNKDYTDKWYYAFITKMEYVNDGRTDIYIETDVIQSWLFDYTVQPSFVEREHTDIDNVGLHTVPENLETGEYICDLAYDNEDLTERIIIMGSTVDLNSEDYEGTGGLVYAGVYSGVRYYAITSTQATNILKALAKAGKVDAVTSIFTAPENLTPINEVSTPYNDLMLSDSPQSVDWAIPRPTKLGVYTPRNNKLLTYPYCYLLMNNNSGGSATYPYEYFGTEATECNFRIYGSITPGCSIRLVPVNYKGEHYNNLEGLNLGKFPVCSWNSDVYTNWLTQNSVNLQVGLAGAGAQTTLSGIGTLASLFTLNAGGVMSGVSNMVSGAQQIGSILGEKYAHSLQPPQAEGNLNSGDVTYAMKKLTFTGYRMCIKHEFAQIIDKYFDMFGYQMNYVHTPLKNHRENYWYTKTIDVNIDGLVPMDDMLKIKACYNTGITFWKNPSNIGNYSVSNKTV